jgi:hypothetical protein
MAAIGLPAALQACARGIYSLEAAARLDRDDFTQFIHTGPGSATTQASTGPPRSPLSTPANCPAPAGKTGCCALAASLAGHAPVILGNAITGLDDRNIQILVRAVLHASASASSRQVHDH